MSPADQASFYIRIVKTTLREVIDNKGKMVLAFGIVSFAILGLGYFQPKVYETSTTIFADQQNIIKPLLADKAAVTKVRDQARVVREVIHSPRILNEVVYKTGLASTADSPIFIEQITKELRKNITVTNIGGNFIRLSYSANDQNRTFNVLTTVTDTFIKDVSESKRAESRQAYLFIDKQVKSYKQQLQDAEENLKRFKAASLDGTELSVSNRISDLRAKLEEMKLDIDDSKTRVRSISAELKKESQFINKRFKTDVYRERLVAAQQRLESLLLTYTEDYPDVVALKLQIDDLKRAMQEAQVVAEDEGQSAESGLNPLYEELRSKLSEEKVELRTKLRRYDASEKLLVEEKERLRRIAEQQAELSELTRDYKVTKSIYEDMLERKEKARLSMTLDVEGQGVNYKIQEPAVYPLTPTGIRFLYFVLAGPILGVLIPIGLMVLFVLVDPRIRFPERLKELESAPTLLGAVPHMTTPITKRIFRSDMIILFFLFMIIMSCYAFVVFARVKEYI